MMNSKTFESDPFKPKNPRNRNRDHKKKDKVIVCVIIKSSSNEQTPAELDPTEEEVLESDNAEIESDTKELLGEDSDTSSGTEKSSKKTMPNHTWHVCLQ